MSLKRLYAFISWAGIAFVVGIWALFSFASSLGTVAAGLIGIVILVVGSRFAWRLSADVDASKPWWRTVDWVQVAEGDHLPDVRAEAASRLETGALTPDQLERQLRIDSARTLDGGTFYRIYAPRHLLARARDIPQP